MGGGSLRVLHIISNLNQGGAQKFLIELVNSEKYLYEKDIFVLNQSNKEFFQKDTESLNIMYSKTKNYWTFRKLFEIRAIIRHYDLVHCHLFQAQYLTVISSFFLKNKPLFITTEHSPYNRRRRPIIKLIEIYIYSKYKKIITVSDAVRESLVNWIGFRNRLVTIYNGIQLKRFEGIETSKKTSKYITILMVGRFTAAKNQQQLIKAMSFLKDHYVLSLVGSGELLNKSAKLVKDLDLSDRIHFHGFDENVLKYYKSASIYVHLVHWEGFGLSVLEAMAAGLPVLSSKVDSLIDIVKDTGLFIETNSPKEIASQIETIISNEILYKLMIEKSLKKATKYSIDITANEYMKVYNALVENE